MLNGKVIIVTGGKGLIGSTFVESIISNGGTAVIADINVTEKDERKEQREYVRLDITDENSLKAMIDKIDKKYKRIDALVNNAYPRNKNYGRRFEDVTYSDFCQNTDMHLGGYFLASQKLSDYFLRQGYGNIVNMASIYGVFAPDFGLYDGTQMTMPVEYAVIKAGVLQLTRYMANYYKGKNIRVNAISPGGVRDKQPEGFLKQYRNRCLNKGMLDGQDIAGTLIFLLSDNSTYINGQNIIVDDGWGL